VAPGLLSLIKTLDPGAKPDGKVGRFDKDQGYVLIAVFGIAAAFFLPLLNFWIPTQRQYEA
jgi:hypothetical protein